MALVCLFSVAFFASCDPEVIENPEPSIDVLVGEGYLYDGQVIEMYEVYSYAFGAASNPLTMKELTNLRIVCGETILCDTNINCTDFSFEGQIYFDDQEEREIVGEAEIIATVTDAAGKTNSAKISISVNKEDNLITTPFEWVRANGSAATGLDEFGLQWSRNLKDRTNAVIEPIRGEDVVMYSIPAEKWDEVKTAADKAALFSDGGVAEVITDYRGVQMESTAEYDDVIASFYKGEYYLLHITKCTVEQRYYVFTIEGEVK